MVIRKTAWPHGTPCWVDLAVDDMDKARAFYSALFGWEIPPGPPEAGGYSMCLKDGNVAAGLGPKMNPDQPSMWTTYLATDDIDATVAKIKEARGQVLVEPMDVMSAGRMAIAQDRDGGVFGLWQAGEHTGADVANEPGSFTWNENMSRDWEANKDFYTAVFGWTYDDMSSEGMSYATFAVPPENRPSGGIGTLDPGLPEEVPAHWRTYFAVEDTDQAVERLQELGGLVMADPFDTPYGRMAAVADDQGAAFMLMAPSTETAADTGDAQATG